MHFTITLGFFCSLGLLAAAHPFPVELDRRVCHFDEINPLITARNANNVKRQSLELGSARPADLQVPLDEVWQHTEETRPADLDFANYGYDQIIAGQGKINYCVRWESSGTVTAAQRADVETAVQRSFKKWVDVLAGYDGFPYSTVDVKVVGWAVTDESLLEGDTSGIEVYTNTDGEGAPECNPDCGRFFHQDGDYSGCPAGADRHYDLSLWLAEGFEGGAGGDWGQRVGSEYFIDNVASEDIHIHLHELGHTFGLDDFYDWTPTGVESFIMKAGASMTITEFDAWMARDWWTKAIKSRYPNTGSSEEVSVSSAAAEPPVAATSAAYSSVAAPFSSVVGPSSPAAPTVSAIPTLSSVVSAFPTGYYAGGNGTYAPSRTAPYPTSGAAFTTSAGGDAPCPTRDAAPTGSAPANNYSPWGVGRWGKVRIAPSPLAQPVKHHWRD